MFRQDPFEELPPVRSPGQLWECLDRHGCLVLGFAETRRIFAPPPDSGLEDSLSPAALDRLIEDHLLGFILAHDVHLHRLHRHYVMHKPGADVRDLLVSEL